MGKTISIGAAVATTPCPHREAPHPACPVTRHPPPAPARSRLLRPRSLAARSQPCRQRGRGRGRGRGGGSGRGGGRGGGRRGSVYPNRLRNPKPSTPMPMTGQPSSTSPMPPKKHAVPGGRERGVGGSASREEEEEPLCAWSGVAAPRERWRGVCQPARVERGRTFELALLEEEAEGLVHADDHHDTREEQDLQTQRRAAVSTAVLRDLGADHPARGARCPWQGDPCQRTSSCQAP